MLHPYGEIFFSNRPEEPASLGFFDQLFVRTRQNFAGAAKRPRLAERLQTARFRGSIAPARPSRFLGIVLCTTHALALHNHLSTALHAQWTGM